MALATHHHEPENQELAMGQGLPKSLSRGVFAGAAFPFRLIPVKNKTFVVDGATGVGFGSFVAAGLPAGNILFLGAVSYLQFAGPTHANLADNWAGDYGVGTTPASDATITAGDVDIIPSTALAAATAEVSPMTRGTLADGSGCGQVFDNTGGTLEVNVNLLVDDANIGADDITFTANGHIMLTYLMLGDD